MDLMIAKPPKKKAIQFLKIASLRKYQTPNKS